MSKEDDVDSIAADIMTYLHRRPLASDSLDGITHWWLVEQAIERNRKLVEQALARLTEERKLVKRTAINSEALYSLDSKQR